MGKLFLCIAALIFSCTRVALADTVATVHPSQVGATVSSQVMGAGMAVWVDPTTPGLTKPFVTNGLKVTRFPGGTAADSYHWETNSYGPGACSFLGKPKPNATFDNFMADFALPNHLDVNMLVNYGSNVQCNGGGDPAEAVAWVQYANQTKGYGLTWWTVGNEQYGNWSLDLRSAPHDPTQYAQVVTQDYYQQMKAASPIPINVCVDGDPNIKGWDTVVFAEATFDCVELHYYPQQTTVSDSFLLHNAVAGITSYIQTVANELVAVHKPAAIYLGEIGSVSGIVGKQTQSIVQSLYAGQVLGELLQDGVTRANWHIAYGGCIPESGGGDFDSSVYGWQNYGSAMIFSDGSIGQNGCGSNPVALGTTLATGNAFAVASHFVRDGEHMLGVSVAGSSDVRGYATTYGSGYALMLFNLSETTGRTVTVEIDGKLAGSYATWMYDKAIYDETQFNVWNGPAALPFAGWQKSFKVRLQPWSMMVIQTT